MPCNPGPSFFASFQDLDPSKGRQCIYFTRQGLRCRHNCSLEDDAEAIRLRDSIEATPTASLGLDLLSDYIVLKCCKAGRHRYHIEGAGLLTSLAQRWQNEIRGRSSSIILDKPAVKPSAVSTPPRMASRSGPQLTRAQTQHSLGSYVGVVPINQSHIEVVPSLQSASEFDPYKTKPHRADTVYRKAIADLRSRDFETGSLYIFSRPSSPGYVKIGWTARFVTKRLERWEKCGYIPHLVWQVDNVPHAQRVEKLVHRELMKEWRRERMCRSCLSSHQEWFEISEERAIQVVLNWTRFMLEAQPYDSEGRLKDPCRKIMKWMDDNGKQVTGQRMLECLQESATVQAVPVVCGPSATTTATQVSQQANLVKAAQPSRQAVSEYPDQPRRVSATVMRPTPSTRSTAPEPDCGLKVEDEAKEAFSLSRRVSIKREPADDEQRALHLLQTGEIEAIPDTKDPCPQDLEKQVRILVDRLCSDLQALMERKTASS